MRLRPPSTGGGRVGMAAARRRGAREGLPCCGRAASPPDPLTFARACRLSAPVPPLRCACASMSVAPAVSSAPCTSRHHPNTRRAPGGQCYLAAPRSPPINHTARMKPAHTPPASRGSVWTLLYRFPTARHLCVRTRAALRTTFMRARIRPLQDPRRNHHRPAHASVVAASSAWVLPLTGGGIPTRPSGRTPLPTRPPLPPAPAFVNDEARAIARHVSRDVCGARIRAPDHTWRRVTDARIVPAGPRVLASTTITVARPRARRVPTVTNRASHAAQHPRGHQVRPDYLPPQIAATCHTRNLNPRNPRQSVAKNSPHLPRTIVSVLGTPIPRM